MSQMDNPRGVEADGESGEPVCAFCHDKIYEAYFEVNGETSCQKCRYTVEDRRANGSGAVRFLRASFAGGLAATAGAGIYYAVLALTEYEFALVSILVGLMVGFAVSWGSGHRGGWVYQTLAVGLTYMAIVSTYVPFVLEAWEDESAAEETLLTGGDQTAGEATEVAAVDPQQVQLSVGDALIGLAAFIVLVAAIPFLTGIENVLGLVIIGFGLFEAWRLNRYQPLTIEGPFRFGGSPARKD
jgi:hypothetical protein